ncbi:MAG: hypothetical protein CEE42_05220 [Promethearchaeota archaeon Loki_b31]|nr:MAG: hypothetical protein CEE42_05220 [Candidatus Lokiarchaeota archaeon Loki_b31]
MQVGEFLEKVLPPRDGKNPFDGKVVWVGLSMGGNRGIAMFSIVKSLMLPYPDGSQYKKVMYSNSPKKNKELHVLYRMTMGAHRNCTWGGKKSDGTPRFKSKRYGTTSVQGTKGSSGGGMTKSSKQYYCKGCAGKVYIERDNDGNAYCVNCGKKMFG